MELSQLTAISPIDGRYRSKVEHLAAYFSEFALMKFRLMVEVEYFIALSQNGFFKLSATKQKQLKKVCSAFTVNDAEEIKQIEKKTNHDVKAVEYFLKQHLKNTGSEKLTEWVHFGLTSQDINNTAYPLMWKHAVEKDYLPAISLLRKRIYELTKRWKSVPMLARTHGQPASPTTLGKEMMVFAERLDDQLQLLKSIPVSGKFGGATGNFNAHYAAFPDFKWKKFADDFLKNQLGLKRQQYTTQIEHYDNLAASFHALLRINTILIDFCRDMWSYISMGYFHQKVNEGEVGSSTMPHKVNPIDFENAEGNLGVANALWGHLAAKLPVSRLQRDLTDSTVLRNMGVPFAHTVIAIKSIEKGISKLVLDKKRLSDDLDNNWAVVSEAIQTVLRREGYPNPYEALKNFTRGNPDINQKTMSGFIDGLEIPEKIKRELKTIRPQNYIGK